MRILRVRGQNLASLQAPFDIDLVGGPLGRAGLFAITGPTGAGKSTLLDAICLCLYDKTPRLASSGGSVVTLSEDDDPGALAANDQRNVLRRGAASAWAEVDFRGKDQQVWTARWQVHRARKSATGRVQPQALSLLAPDGSRVAGNKSMVLNQIQALIGLNFDQFRRSVLLAQGDFAAFLRAKETDRAALLEQMTGTRIYSKLAAAALEKRRLLNKQLDSLRTKIDVQGVLPADQRQRADQDVSDADQLHKRADAALKKAEHAVQWHTEQANRQGAVAQAQAQFEAATKVQEEAAPQRQRLDQAELGWDLRRLATLSQDHADTAGAKQTDADADRTTRNGARAHVQRAQDQLAQAHATLARAHQALVDQLQTRRAAAQIRLSDAQAWLDDHPEHGRWAAPRALETLQRDVDASVSATNKFADATNALPIRKRAVQDGMLAARDAEESLGQAQTALANATSAVHTARAKAGAFDHTGLDHQQRDLQIQERALTALESLASQATDLSQRQADWQERASKARDAQAKANQLAEEARARLTTLGPRQKEARHALKQARAAMDATALRATLQTDQPCPVCGGLDHPWADGSPLARLHDDQQARLESLDTDVQKAQTDITTHSTQADSQGKQAASAQDQSQEQAKRLQALESDWKDAATTATEPALAGPLGAEAPLKALRARLIRLAADLKTQRDEAQQARKALETTQHTKDQAEALERRAQGTANTTQEQVNRARAAHDQAVQLHNSTAGRATEARRALATSLDPATAELPALDGWQMAPQQAVETCRAAAKEWTRKTARRDEAEEALRELEDRLPVAKERRDDAVGRAATEDLALTPRPQLPANPSPPDATAWLDQRIDQAGIALLARTQEAAAAELDLEKASEKATASDSAAKTAQEQAQKTAAKLQQARTAQGIAASTLAKLVALPDDWLRTQRRTLQDLEDNRKTAQATLKERQQQVNDHALRRPQGDAATRPGADEARAHATAQQEEAATRWSDAQALVKRDELAKEQTAKLQEALAQQTRQAKPWLQLATGVGPHQDSFKKFAQSLTLEALLDHANHHLHALHPRYGLARIHKTDLEILIIDHDLGDEARTVQSLSGGESFLVSLALALALSSLSSRDVVIESLFIDEGFGSLDQHTLDAALSVLDGLQAQGRQVGVISHVGGLGERIGARVQVSPQGGGRSTVTVVEG